MKSKTSPTSPKAKNEQQQDKELDKYYKDALTQIKKPEKIRTPIWFLFVVIIFGFLAGIIGQLILLSYGSEIPYLDKLDFFSLTEEQPFFISLNGNNKTTKQSDIENITANAKNSLVQIYEKKDSTGDLTSAYLPADQLGLAMAITNDGYFLTSENVINDFNKEYVAITDNKEIYLIKEILGDPATDFLIFNTDIKDMKPPAIVADKNINNNDEVLIVNHYDFGTDLQSEISSITDSSYNDILSVEDYIQSTEVLDEKIRLSDVSLPENSMVYSNNGNAIGMTFKSGEVNLIYPFYLISEKINYVLENEKVIRPYIGITYINLYNVTNLPKVLNQDSDKGALIYFDEEGDYPGIVSNSPAEKAGLENNDIILMVDNIVVNGHASLSQIIQGYNAGDIITLKVLRAGVEKEIKLTLESST